MKVIDLLNKIANGEEVPDEIKIGDDYYYRNIRADVVRIDFLYREKETTELWLDYGNIHLDDELEIIEDEPRDIEVCGSLFTRSEYNRLAGIKEDKKIEKVDVNHLQQIKKWKRAKVLGNKINEIIDYINGGTNG